ncbi:hypothetical protein V1477_015755 [Vespula maculifrons]|uniref:Uncharacterized protein n=1 Tax=Vespula maculifrons TaxID=7453 RepID=A0ABD2BB83_VESMC
MSDIIIERVLGTLRCVLDEIQSKTELVTVKVGPSSDFLVVTVGQRSDFVVVARDQNKSYNNVLTLTLPYYMRRTRPLSTAMCTRRNTKRNSTSNCPNRSKVRLCCRQRVLCELRCALVEIHNKIELIIVKVGQRSDFVVVARDQNKSYNNVLTLTLPYFMRRTRPLSTTTCTRRNTKQN